MGAKLDALAEIADFAHMKTTTAKKVTTTARLRHDATKPAPRRKVKMPDFMKNLKTAYGDYTFDRLLARVENGL